MYAFISAFIYGYGSAEIIEIDQNLTVTAKYSPLFKPRPESFFSNFNQ